MIQPKFDNVLVKPLKNQIKKKYGNIVIPDTTKEKPILGEVVNVGKGAYNTYKDTFIGSDFKIGDKVILPKLGGTKLEWEEQEYILIPEKLILAVIQ